MACVLLVLLLAFTCPSEAFQDHYGLLGVTSGASQKDIAVAFRKLSLKWHPDKNPGNREEAELRMRELSESYSTLGKVENRRIYDTLLSKKPTSWAQKPENTTPGSSDSSSSWSFAQRQKQEPPSFWQTWSLARLFRSHQHQRPQPRAQSESEYYYVRFD
jgi:DnaJ-class molecular chaperone